MSDADRAALLRDPEALVRIAFAGMTRLRDCALAYYHALAAENHRAAPDVLEAWLADVDRARAAGNLAVTTAWAWWKEGAADA